MIDENTKHAGDVLALVSGGAGTLAQWSDTAGQLTPIFSLVFVGLSILWLLYRFADRIRYGPRRD